MTSDGFPGGASGKEPDCPCRRHKRARFNPWDGKIPWQRAWQPTPTFLLGEAHGQRSLVGYSLRGLKELDMTELFNLYVEYIMRNAGLEETQAGIKIAGRNINNNYYWTMAHPSLGSVHIYSLEGKL